MAAPPNFEEGQSTYRPPRFNGQYYGWWKTRMHDFIMAEDSELWDVICDGPYVPTKKVGDPPVTMPKSRKEYNDADRKVVEKNFVPRKFCTRGTTQVKQSKIDMLTIEYELFRMKDDESIQDMRTRFTSIINELHSFGEIIPWNKLVRKILSVLHSSWESKVNVIIEAKDLHALTIDELIGNLKTYKMKKKKDSEREPKKEKNLVLKVKSNDSSEEDSDMAYLTKRFQKMPEHFIKDFPLLKQEHFEYNSDKAAKRNPVPDKRFKRKNVADNVMKQALAAWGDSSSESEEENDAGDSSMMAFESEANEYDSIFALMAQSDNDENDDNDEVNFRDIQRNLKSYSPKKLMSLANVLIDAYHSLVDNKDALTIELGDAEQTRDDMVVCVVDLKETICNLENEKEVLTEKIASVEHERDDLIVVAVDLKETIENFNLKKTIDELKAECRPGNYDKGKEVASEAHIKLENELNAVKTSLCAQLEKNRQLQADLKRVKNDLEKSLKWTWSSDAITTMYVNNGNSERKQSTMIHGQWMLKAHDWEYHGVSFTKSPTMSLLSVSQICDKGNKVEFLSKICTVTNLLTGEVVLVVKRYKNIYVADFESLQSGLSDKLTKGQISAQKGVKPALVSRPSEWRKNGPSADRAKATAAALGSSEKGKIRLRATRPRLGHTSFSLLNKLVQKDLVHGLPKSKFKEHKVCDAYARGKHVKSSFKTKKDVSTSKPLDHLHMDLCGPMRVQSRGGKRYIFVIVDDYSRFTWTLFLRTKDETFEVFVAFVKKIQVKME
ncbi:uncharacterized protein [Nicotiana sylvestris]|uniref:uncharacterized protein n=1 Tax=Nicotiana sylvestris TaxID=4096 RepID=UPI00388CDAD6